MNFWNYITKPRKGKEAQRIELEAMKDPFLADAIEGYDLVKNEDHTKRIEDVKDNIRRKTQKRFNLIRTGSIAASLLICIGLGSYFLLHNDNPLRKENHVAYSLDMIPSEEIIAPPPPSESPIDKQETDFLEDYAGLSKERMYIQEEAPLHESFQHQRTSHNLTVPEPTPSADYTIKGEPKPETGEKAYKEYVYENLYLPAFDECGNAKGQVVVAFKVNAKGRPYDLDVKKSLCSTADEEALRVVQEGPNWTLGDKIATVTIRF